MKRKKVMRLLAVAMAASVALTSQGIPAGLTAVEASTIDTGLVGGHLYQQVTPKAHEHKDGCYSTFVTAAKNDNYVGKYYVKIDSTAYGELEGDEKNDWKKYGENYYRLVKEGDRLAASGTDVTIATPDTVTTEYVGDGKTGYIFNALDETGAVVSDKFAVYTGTEITTEDSGATKYKIETAYEATKSTTELGSKVAYLTTSVYTTIKSLTLDSESVVTSDTEGSLVYEGNSTVSSDGWYKVTQYGLVTDANSKTAALTVPGAIEVPANTVDYVDDNTYGFVQDSNATSYVKEGVYVPLVVTGSASEPNSYTGGEIIKIDKTIYGYNSSKGWLTLTVNQDVPGTFTIDSSDVKIPLVKLADRTCGDPEYDSYSYYKLEASGTTVEPSSKETTITDDSKIYKVTDGDTKYYVDVCDQFVTGIKLKTGADSARVVSSTTDEKTIDDVIVLAKKDAADTGSNDTEVERTKVSSDFSAEKEYAEGSNTVKITKINSDELYVTKEKTGATIVKTGDGGNVGVISSIEDFTEENMKALGLSDTAITYTVSKLTAPTIAAPSAVDGTAYSTAKYENLNVYDVSENDSKVTVTAPTPNTDNATKGTWKYKWVDKVSVGGAEAEAQTTDDPAEFASLKALDITEPGLHTVYLEAYLDDDTTTAVGKSGELQFYVVKKDTGTTLSATEKTYDGDVVVTALEGTLKDVTPTYSYYVTESGSGAAVGNALPKDAGDYTIVATFEANIPNGLAESTAETTVKISKKDITITPENQTVEIGGTFTADKFTVSSTSDGTLNKLPDGLKAIASVVDETTTDVTALSTAEEKVYTLSYKIENKYAANDVLKNYDVTSTATATLTVKEVTKPVIGTFSASGTTATVEGDVGSLSVYDADDGGEVTVAAPTVTLEPADENWKYTWVDEVTVNGETAPASESKVTSLTDYKTAAVGKHKVYIKAYYGTSETAAVTSGAVEFYVVAKDKDAKFGTVADVNVGTPLSVTAASTANPDAEVTYEYFKSDDTDKTISLGSTAPTAVGSYVVVATFPESLALGLKKTVVESGTVSIKRIEKTETYGPKTIELAAGAETERTLSLDDQLSAYADGGNLEGTINESSSSLTTGTITFDGTDNTVKYTLNTTEADKTITLTGKLTNSKYSVDVTITLTTAANGKVHDIKLTPVTSFVYGDDYTAAELAAAAISDYSGNERYYTVKFGATEAEATDAVPTAVGTTYMYVSYTNDDVKGSDSTTVTIAKKKLTLTVEALSIEKGGNLTNAKYTVASANGTKEVNELPDTLTAAVKVLSGTTDVTSSVSTLEAGSYTLTYDVAGNGTDNYDVEVKTATLTVQGSTPSNPPADTDKTPSTTTTEPTLTTNEDGDKVIVDADGKVIANELVTTSDGKSYVTDEDGVIRTSQIAEVGDVKVYVGKNGVVATDKAVTYEGKKYYATETGEIATNSFVTTARGNMVYATKTGALKTSTAFTVNGKKYYAKASGVIATTGFVKTAKGNTVYATKSGALKVNTAFKASNGKKYVADKNGKIVKGKKITIGNKVYTTNKKGVIVKVTTKKK